MRASFARAWMALASASLLLSGFLALIVTGAKMPVFKEIIPNLDLIRWCLVVHVNLATLVWFTALPVGLVHLAISDDDRQFNPGVAERAGLFFAAIGVLLMLSVPPSIDIEIVLANYIPVLDHPRYYAALALYFAGVALNFISPHLLRASNGRTYPGLNEVRFGLGLGGIFFFLAVAGLISSYWHLSAIQLITTKTYFEVGMWGGGHLLQHASAVFLICGWVVLLSHEAGRPLLTRARLFPYFAVLAIPALVAPILFAYSVTSNEYREGFTMLMRWGIAPVSLCVLYALIRAFRLSREQLTRYRVIAFALSAVLLLLGFLFGALIRGADMRVPGHYHAAIGAVTLTFMAVALHVLAGKEVNRWMSRMAWTYGCGQILFAGGMFVAGSFGVGRKTYGSEHMLTNWGQYAGFGMIVVGGLVAFAGGVFFALAIGPYLFGRAANISLMNSVVKSVADSFETINGFMSTKRSITQLSSSKEMPRPEAKRSRRVL